MADVPSFWHEMLLPMYEEWRACPWKDHRAKALALFIDNMAERFAHQHGRKDDEKRYRQELRAVCPEFGLLYDLADSAKHVVLTRTRPGARLTHIDGAAMSPMFDDWDDVDSVVDWDANQVLILSEDADKGGQQHKFSDLVVAVMTLFGRMTGQAVDLASDRAASRRARLRQMLDCLDAGASLRVDQEWLQDLFGPPGADQQRAAEAFAGGNRSTFRYEQDVEVGVFGRDYSRVD